MIKGHGRINRDINVFLGTRYKSEFIQLLPSIDTKELVKGKVATGCTLYSFSGSDQFYDQVISILSFLYHVGLPKKWIVISDGTHSEYESQFFRSLSFVRLCDFKTLLNENHYSNELVDNTAFWQIKKFFSYSSVKVTSPTIFLDSDILFFQSFKRYFGSLQSNNWFLSELGPHFDPDYLVPQAQNYTNSGFLILNSNVDWSFGCNYLLEKLQDGDVIGHFTEQTAVEMVVKQNHCRFLDPRLFVINLEDHFTYGTRIKNASICIRHFVGPIRFRMWKIAKEFSFYI